ncbi:MAG: hypothetical protein ACFB4I_10545 [Cyanophyceae cyanobacterium]
MLGQPKKTAITITIPAAFLDFSSKPASATVFQLEEAMIAEIDQAFNAGALSSEE